LRGKETGKRRLGCPDTKMNNITRNIGTLFVAVFILAECPEMPYLSDIFNMPAERRGCPEMPKASTISATLGV